MGGARLTIQKPIYRVFAELSSQQEALQFARRYGAIASRASPASWKREQKELRRLLEQWDAIRQDPDEYAARIRDAVGSRGVPNHQRLKKLREDELEPEGRRPETALEKRRAEIAAASLSRSPRTALEKRRADLASELRYKLTTGRALHERRTPDDEREPLVLVHFPDDWSGLRVEPARAGLNGLSAVWFALAQAISGHGLERDCPFCHVAFEPVRSDARFCSPGCKLKAHRERAASTR